MTQELELIFDTQITNVSKCASSIFSREDVIIILKTVRQYIHELPEVAAPTFTKDHILNSVKEMLNDYSWDEFISCEPELHGSYGDSYSLEMNTSFEEHEFKRCFISELEDYFTPDNE